MPDDRPDSILLALEQYFAGEGRFSAYNRRADPPARVKAVFLPYFATLSEPEQRRLIHLMAAIATGQDPRFAKERLKALDVLWLLTRPWPEDCRRLLLEAKDTLLAEFSRKDNLVRWAAWDEEAHLDGWCEGPAYALTLYSILLAVAEDDELQPVVDFLLTHTKSEEFRSQLVRRPRQVEGIRLSSPLQFTREQHTEHFLREQLEHRRKQRGEGGTN